MGTEMKLIKASDAMRKRITKEEWLNNKDKYDFILFDKVVARGHGVTAAFILAISEWKDTTDIKIIKKYTNTSEGTIRKKLKSLIDDGFIAKKGMSPEIAKQKVLKGDKNYKCSWCNNKVHVLQEHHYPVPKSKGGCQTVKICPTCHYSYHHIYGNGGAQYEI